MFHALSQHFGCPPGADGQAGGRVAEGHQQRDLGAALHHAGDADAPRQQLVGDLQEAVARPRDRGGELPLPRHVAGGIQQRPARHSDP